MTNEGVPANLKKLRAYEARRRIYSMPWGYKAFGVYMTFLPATCSGRFGPLDRSICRPDLAQGERY
jgi:hypothetical protein